MGILILVYLLGSVYFTVLFDRCISGSFFYKAASFFIFIGFSVKIPLWPFHFWLTKTHVEASTGFSIFLSGILVKTALLGLFKFKFIFFYLNEFFIFFIISYGVIDVSLKMYSQVDLKKLVAYATIQEMGLLMLVVCFDSIYTRQLLLYFCFFHTAISGIFFLINDFIYKRVGSRHLLNISGLCTTQPGLFLVTVVSLFIFLGIPFTVKFYIELQFLYKLLYTNIYYGFLFIFIVQYISIVFFFKNVVLFLFGPIFYTKSLDITLSESIYFFYFFVIVVMLSVL